MDKEAKLKEKKKLIIEALKRCLERNVYSNITVQEVADEAGFSKGGLLHYFQSKEDMYLELIRDLFEEITADHEKMIEGNLETVEQASLTALLSIEKFFLDRRTTKIFLNLMLYAFEDEKIMKQLRDFLHKHLDFYATLIEKSREGATLRRKTDLDPAVTARIAQIVVLGAGIFESVDTTDLDHTNLVRYILSMLKG
jgi:AcrR family transcriptional regulator